MSLLSPNNMSSFYPIRSGIIDPSSTESEEAHNPFMSHVYHAIHHPPTTKVRHRASVPSKPELAQQKLKNSARKQKIHKAANWYISFCAEGESFRTKSTKHQKQKHINNLHRETQLEIQQPAKAGLLHIYAGSERGIILLSSQGTNA